MEALAFLALVTGGFTASAEFSSWAFVHPVLRRLPTAAHLRVEQDLLRTFGRVMPVLMPLSTVLVVLHAAGASGDAPLVAVSSWAAAAAFLAAVVTTVSVNVPINKATARWDPDDPPPDWQATRRRWERFQGLRAVVLLVGYVLLCLATALRA